MSPIGRSLENGRFFGGFAGFTRRGTLDAKDLKRRTAAETLPASNRK